MEDNQNIEKFFKDKMNQPIRPEGWNTPDDSVWEGISSELDKDKISVKNIQWFPVVILFLLSALLFSGYFHHLQSETIHKLRQEIAACDSATKSGSDSGKTNNAEKQVAENNQIIPAPANENYEVTNARSKGSVVRHDIGDYHVSPLEHAVNGTISFVESLPDAQKPELTKKPKDFSLHQPEYQSVAHIPVLMRDFLHLENEPDIITLNKPVQRKKKYSSLSGISLGSIYWMDRQKGSMLNPLSELLVEEKTFQSAVAGLHFNRQISGKWSFTAGAEFYNRTQLSLYAIQLPYSKDTEIAAGNGFENHFQHSLPTGLGNVNTYLVLSRSTNSEFSDNEIVSLDFEMKNRATLLALPVGLSYYFSGFGKGLFVTSGIRTEVVIHNRISETSLKSHHPLVQDNHMNVEYNNLQMNKLNMSLTMGAGYQVPVWRDYHVSCIIQYGQALNPVFRSENYAHDIHSLQGQVVLSKKW